ncbi:unnamed protein product, partial [Rotaria magnacalcarata]
MVHILWIEGIIEYSFGNKASALIGVTLAGQSGLAGSVANQFSSPTAITLDQYGNIYVMDSGNDRIQQWTPGATFGITVASAAMSTPRGMAFDPSGNLAVADSGYHRIVQFSVIC